MNKNFNPMNKNYQNSCQVFWFLKIFTGFKIVFWRKFSEICPASCPKIFFFKKFLRCSVKIGGFTIFSFFFEIFSELRFFLIGFSSGVTKLSTYIRVPLCIDLRRLLWDQALWFITLGDSNCWRRSNKYSDLLTRSIYLTIVINLLHVSYLYLRIRTIPVK